MNKNLVEFDEAISFYAFRYVLGRMTYAVPEIASHLIKYKFLISPGTKKLIVNQIKAAIRNGNAGVEFDVKVWQRIVDEFEAIS